MRSPNGAFCKSRRRGHSAAMNTGALSSLMGDCRPHRGWCSRSSAVRPARIISPLLSPPPRARAALAACRQAGQLESRPAILATFASCASSFGATGCTDWYDTSSVDHSFALSDIILAKRSALHPPPVQDDPGGMARHPASSYNRGLRLAPRGRLNKSKSATNILPYAARTSSRRKSTKSSSRSTMRG